MRVKGKEERPGVLRKLSGKQDNTPTLVLTFTDEEESTKTTQLDLADTMPSKELGLDVLQGMDAMLAQADADDSLKGLQLNTLEVVQDLIL